MNSALTFRLPALAVPAESGQASEAPADSLAVNSETLDETLIIQICEGSREALAILFQRYAGSSGSVLPGLARRIRGRRSTPRYLYACPPGLRYI